MYSPFTDSPHRDNDFIVIARLFHPCVQMNQLIISVIYRERNGLNMQQLAIPTRQTRLRSVKQPGTPLILRDFSDQDDGGQNFSISVLEWLNAELRKEAEKQEIVALRANVNIMDRLQNMLSSKATGITIMTVGLFTM